MRRFIIAIMLIVLALQAHSGRPAVLDKDAHLAAENFWANKDFDWYKNNIPFLDCPDSDIQTTYYYRWELVTRHVCYGSPNTGYTFTEFANRPFWSGRYGAISCPSGHQIYEIRWLRDPTYVRDYLRYWFRTSGAQPRKYSSWLADSAWATQRVHPNDEFTLNLLPDLIANHNAWRERHWVADVGLYWQTGHDDGMEFDINAQQTNDILRGGQSLRPSFNAYMWADMQALAKMSHLAGKEEDAEAYLKEAKGVKQKVQSLLWDPKRNFFFPMSNQRHEKDGHVVEKHTLTYQTGKYAGSEHGRELHGYVPWAFGMPDPGYEAAWQYLMDPEYFYSEYGPTSVERNDPQFVLKDACCWWSGQSWPFATTQTLKAMAKLIQDYEQNFVSRDDYNHMLHKYAISHRKDGKPYIAEALNPFNGSWRGHDFSNRSEHYFHSGFVDLVITGLAGLQPSDDDRVVVNPLIPNEWKYFALEDVPYKGHLLSIVWDQTGERYGLGPGLHLLVNGNKAARSVEIGRLEGRLPSIEQVPISNDRLLNFAVNNDGDYYPRFSASFVGKGTSLSMISDGQYRYDKYPSNRWTAAGSSNKKDWVEIDLGKKRELTRIEVYVIDDGQDIVAPKSLELQYRDGDTWRKVPQQTYAPKVPAGGRPNVISFPDLESDRFRVVFEHADNGTSGMTELQAWGPGELPYVAPSPPAGNISFSRNQQQFPKASASFSDRFGGTPEKAIDGRTSYQPSPMNRWTSYGSPNKSDWLEVDFGKREKVGRIELLIYDDRGGVQPPKSFTIEYWNGDSWQEVQNASTLYESPVGGVSNTVRFDSVSTSKVRAVFVHNGASRSGVTEFEVWEK